MGIAGAGCGTVVIPIVGTVGVGAICAAGGMIGGAIALYLLYGGDADYWEILKSGVIGGVSGAVGGFVKGAIPGAIIGFSIAGPAGAAAGALSMGGSYALKGAAVGAGLGAGAEMVKQSF